MNFLIAMVAISASPACVDASLAGSILVGTASPFVEVRCYHHRVRQPNSPRQESVLIQTVRCDANGRFVLQLHPGLYRIETPHGSQLCFAWARGTAPPSTKPLVIRGQGPPTAFRREGLDLARRAMILGGIGAATWSAARSNGS